MANDRGVSKVAARINRQKTEVLKFLAETPVVATACRKADVSRATYYRWLTEDDVFSEEVNSALLQGRDFRCDMAESVVFGKVAEKDLGAAKYLLEHNSSRYMPQPKTERQELNRQVHMDPANLASIESQQRELVREYEERLRELIVNSIRNKPNDST